MSDDERIEFDDDGAEEVMDPEEDFMEDEEEYDDEEEDEAPVVARGGGGRKKAKSNPFLDMAAEEDDDEDEDEGEAEPGWRDNEKRSYEELPPRRFRSAINLADRSEEEIVRDLEERHSGAYVEDFDDRAKISQQSMLPTVKDPKLWMIKCKPGSERVAVLALMQRFLDGENKPDKLLIKSAVCCEKLKGYLYVEAEKEAHVRNAIKNMRVVFQRDVKLVPIKEMVDVLGVAKKEIVLNRGMWVRVKRGLYANDLGQVQEFDDSHRKVVIKIIPRLDLSYLKAKEPGEEKRKRKLRPPARFFNPDEINQIANGLVEAKRDGEYLFEKERYRDGFLYKAFNVKSLETRDITPTLEEFQRFNEKVTIGTEDNDEEDTPMHDVPQMKPRKISFVKGDTVRVVSGDLKNLTGVVESVEDNTVTLMPRYEGLHDLLSFPAGQLQKYFKVGDHVKVITGKFEGETGLILRIEDNTVVMFSDIQMKEIPVLASDIQECAEVASGKLELGSYELHDMVQINQQSVGVIVKVERDSFKVLDCNEKILTIRLQEMGNKRSSKNANGFDQKQNPVQVGDVLLVTSGPHKTRQGTVKHINRQYAFLHSKDVLDNSGIFVVRTSNCVLLGGKNPMRSGGGESPFGQRSNRGPWMSPARSRSDPPQPNQSGPQRNGGPQQRRGPRHDGFVGKTVRIIAGMWKGYIGIVKDATETTVRVELHTKNKVITVPRNTVVAVDGDGSKASMPPPSYHSNTTSSSGGGMWDSVRTPLRSADDAPSTPMRMGTPMRMATPSHSSDPWNPQAPQTPRHDWGDPDGDSHNNPFSPYSPATGLFDQNTPEPRYANPATPSGFNTYTPSSYSDAGTPHEPHTPYSSTPQAYPTTPSTPGSSITTPLTPGTPAESYEEPGTAQTHAESEGWLTTDIEVVVSSDNFKNGQYSGLKGIIKEVYEVGADKYNCTVEFPDKGSQPVIVPGDCLEPVLPRKLDKIKIIRGELKGTTGVLIGVDPRKGDGIVKMEIPGSTTPSELKIMLLSHLARFVPAESS